MKRQVTFYTTLAISTSALILLPFPDTSGHGNYATALACIALAGTIGCITLSIASFVKEKSISPNLEMSLSMAISPVAQILLIELLGKSLSLEDLSGVTWMSCGWLSELCAIPLLIAIAVHAIRRN